MRGSATARYASRDCLLGEEGHAFAVAQARLGGGRIHHAMRTVARCQQAFDMMCVRVLSRKKQGGSLAEKQMVQESIAETWVQIHQFRLLVLHTAWLIDQGAPAGVRQAIAACKFEAARLLVDVTYRSMHMHGALGVSNELPLARMWMYAPQMGVTDGPTEVHKITAARQILKGYQPAEGPFPSAWLPPKIEAARQRYAGVLEHHLGNQ